MADVANSVFALGSALRDRELSDLETQKENELALVGDNAKAKEKIEKKFAKEEAKIKRKQAISDKILALFNAGINTAVAVTQVLAIPLLPILIAAAGAVQIAAIAAAPLPKFKGGVKNKPADGLGIVSDEQGSFSGHSREIINIPGVGLMLSPDKPTIMDLPKESDVIPNFETELLLKGGIDANKLDEMISSNKRIENAIINRPENIANLTRAGFTRIYKDSKTYIKYKENLRG